MTEQSGNRLFGIRWNEASRWWGSVKLADGIHSMEFDVIASAADKSVLLVGECKWTNPEMASSLHDTLVEKARRLPFAGDKEIVPVLFLKYPPKDVDSVSDLNILYPADVIRLAFG